MFIEVDLSDEKTTLMLTITSKEHAAALGMTPEWSSALLRTVPSYGHPRRYSLAGALATLRPKYRRYAPALLAASLDDGELYVGLSVDSANQLAAWFGKDPEYAERLRYCHNQFFQSLAASVKSAAWFDDVESLRSLLCLSAPVIKYVISGDKSVLPFWPRYVTAFCVIHSTGGFDVDYSTKLAA